MPKEDTHSVYITRSKAPNWQRTPRPVWVGDEGDVSIANNTTKDQGTITHHTSRVRLHARSYKDTIQVTVTCSSALSEHAYTEYTYTFGPDGLLHADQYRKENT